MGDLAAIAAIGIGVAIAVSFFTQVVNLLERQRVGELENQLIDRMFQLSGKEKRKNDELDPAEKPKNDDAPRVMLGDDGELFDVIED